MRPSDKILLKIKISIKTFDEKNKTAMRADN
jgi:hypothetical protein